MRSCTTRIDRQAGGGSSALNTYRTYRHFEELLICLASTRPEGLCFTMTSADGPNPDPSFAVHGPIGWTCATWVIKVTLDLDELGWCDLPALGVTQDTIYRTVLDRAWAIRELFDHPGGSFAVLGLHEYERVALAGCRALPGWIG